MTITYPVPMPTTGIAASDFQIMYNDAVNTLNSGSSYATEIGPAYWEIDLSTTNVSTNSSRFRLWRAFLDSLRGSKKSCLLYDPDKPYPSAYPNGAGLSDGAGTISSITDRRTLGVSGFQSGLILKASDYIGFVQSGRYSLHRILEDVTLSGGSGSISIEPSLSFLFTTGAVANVIRPACEAIIVPKSISSPRGLEAKPISFSARSRA